MKMHSTWVKNDDLERAREIDAAKKKTVRRIRTVPLRGVIRYLSDPRDNMLYAVYRGRIVVE